MPKNNTKATEDSASADTPTTNGRTSRPIMDAYQTDIANFVAVADTKRRQPLAGFDEDYVDIVDYIVRCTHKIWEERSVGLIYTHYSSNIVIHTADGTTYGRDRVIADSIKTMNAFPDIRLFADDVIWSGNDQDGFHSSHRISWTGHNRGHSIYGPPTGRKVVRYGVAQCLVKENRVIEEWICRDELALVRQLGYDEHALAREMARKAADTGIAPPVPPALGEVGRLNGQSTPEPPVTPAGEDDIEGFVRRSFHEIWNWRLLNKLRDYYAPNYLAWVPPYRKIHGQSDYMVWILSLMAAFSDLSLTVDHVCSMGTTRAGRVATRWWLQGTHDGPGSFGEPTGKRINILGITHQQMRDGQFVQEWTCFDQFALLKQLYYPGA